MIIDNPYPIDSPQYYNTWVTPSSRTVKTTTREYDKDGNLVKEIVVEETTNQGQGWDYTPYRVTWGNVSGGAVAPNDGTFTINGD